MIALVPVGDIEQSLFLFLKESLETTFKRDVVIESALRVPYSAYNPARDQYYAPPVIRLISDCMTEYDKVLGIIGYDLWSLGLNFIFGEVERIGGRTGIISVARLRQEFYNLPPETSLLYERSLKEAVHELGHLYGLMHCDNPRCVMHFSNSLPDTDYKTSRFCDICMDKLQSHIQRCE